MIYAQRRTNYTKAYIYILPIKRFALKQSTRVSVIPELTYCYHSRRTFISFPSDQTVKS